MTESAELQETLNPQHAALIVWDMQVGIAGQAFNLGTLRPAFEQLLASARDSHVPTIWSLHIAPPLEYTPEGVLRRLMEAQHVHEPSRLKLPYQAGTADVAFLPGLAPLTGELVLEKSTGSFFIGTPLELHLRARHIRTLVLTGVTTEGGIDFTARHASALGFSVVIAEDAVGSRTLEGQELGMSRLRRTFHVVKCQRVIDRWARS